MSDDTTIEVDMEEDIQDMLVDVFDGMYPPGKSVPIEHLRALPEEEFRRMKIKVASLIALLEYSERIIKEAEE